MLLQFPLRASFNPLKQMHGHSQSDSITQSSRVGAWLSIVCAVHCALMPLVITVLPIIGLEFLASHALEVIILAGGLGFGAYGVARAYFKYHRDLLPVGLLLAGSSLVVSGLFLVPEHLEHFFIPAGAILVGIAQVVNIRMSRVCTTC
jgi:MerC mercury resistance protein